MAPNDRRQIQSWSETIERDGYVIAPQVFDQAMVERFAREIGDALMQNVNEAESLRNRSGQIFAGRNLMSIYPPTRWLWRSTVLQPLLVNVLGSQAGLVRALYFDKPPRRTWSLPWHKDMTIAVRDNQLVSSRFQRPTRKAGVPHVEAPPEILRQMLTLRIHLDDMTADNGPLQVIRGSHRHETTENALDRGVRTILLKRGDVFCMRPLLTHSSIASGPDTEQHRRTLHLEFAALPQLPDGFAWHEFEPVTPK